MAKNPDVVCKPEDEEPYAPSPVGAHVLTPEQAIEFERRQAEPPRQPSETAREAVRMFHATVKR